MAHFRKIIARAIGRTYRRLQPEKKIGGLVAKRGVAEASRGSTPDNILLLEKYITLDKI